MALADRSHDSAGVLATLTAPFLRFVETVGTLLLLSGKTVLYALRPPYRLGQLLAAMEFIGVQSVFIVSLTGIFSGMVLALQTTNSLRLFSAEGVVGSVVAISLTRELSPVFTAHSPRPPPPVNSALALMDRVRPGRDHRDDTAGSRR